MGGWRGEGSLASLEELDLRFRRKNVGSVLLAKDWSSIILRAHARRYMGACQEMEGIQFED